MLNNLDLSLFYYIGAIALVMIANTCLGVVKANKYNEFSWKVFREGLIKYLLILVSVTFIFGAGVLLPELEFTLPVNEESVTIVQMLSILALATLLKYLKSCYENFVEIENLNKELEKKTVKEVQKEEYLG